MINVAESVNEGAAKVAPSTTEKQNTGLPNVSIPSNPTVQNTPKINSPQASVEVKPQFLAEEPPREVYYAPLDRAVRIGSRKVRIVVIPKPNMLPKDAKAAQLRSEVTKKVSSQWKRGTKDIIRGLTSEEEQMYLPNIIALKPEHDDWVTKVYEWWANFSFMVHVDNGIEFEAGFKLKKNRDGSYGAEPINIRDYISYNFAKECANVANEGSDNLNMYTFQLIDTSEAAIREEVMFSIKAEVDRLFYKLLDDSKINQASKAKIDHIIETVGGEKGLGISIYGMTEIQKQLELQKIKDKNLRGFKDLVEDRYLENKAIIRKGVTFGKIVQEGNAYFYNGVGMGKTLMEAVLWLDDKANSHHKVILLEALSQYSK
jgi:hypothetical protein